MKVECEVLPTLEYAEESAVVTVRRMRDSVHAALDALSLVDEGPLPHDARRGTVLGKGDGPRSNSVVVLKAEELVVAHTRQHKVILETTRGGFISMLTLRDLEQGLGDQFVRISKSAIVNLDHAVRVHADFTGATAVELDNGTREWISRRYWSAFKGALGL